ncbi:Protein CBG13761 [Caenorhabditis briggsae]|uniref:Protein CBG13761 n=1 Tax=Caenorhabditis briggsae TaxID=6238 RepID=A8XIM7_CAEBR|nr:Protein CBG13761 [Caenorhabditis briggsae]CAP32502.1 Protein CBG13761 [Caenorhabditis briggsae]
MEISKNTKCKKRRFRNFQRDQKKTQKTIGGRRGRTYSLSDIALPSSPLHHTSLVSSLLPMRIRKREDEALGGLKFEPNFKPFFFSKLLSNDIGLLSNSHTPVTTFPSKLIIVFVKNLKYCQLA